jgi:aromatic ring-opening dioxygenase LigB subunit
VPLVIAAISPHGFPLIPALSDDAEGGMRTRAALLELNRRFRAARLDAIVIAGPHGIRTAGSIAVAYVRRGAGTLHWRDRTVEMNLPFDTRLTQQLIERARAADLPITEVAYGGSDPRAAVLPLDWGLMTPLWFAGHDRELPGYGYVTANYDHGDPEPTGPPVVAVTPSRQIPREQTVAFGRVVAELAEESPKRIGLVASCDWSHKHLAGSPYGFHPAAREVDAMVVSAVRANELLRLIELDEELVRETVVDGLWQALVLGGALQVVPMAVEVLSYEVPSYYGQLVATFQRVEG